jgi:hypothetical protein
LAWVVDDYHLIDSQAVGFLLTHLPPRLRLVLAGAATAAAAGQAAARGQLAGRPDSASRLLPAGRRSDHALPFRLRDRRRS